MLSRMDSMCFCACRSPAVPPPRESTYLNSAVPVRPRPTYENGEAPGRPARRRRSDEGLPAPPADRWPSVLRAVMGAGAVEGRKGRCMAVPLPSLAVNVGGGDEIYSLVYHLQQEQPSAAGTAGLSSFPD